MEKQALFRFRGAIGCGICGIAAGALMALLVGACENPDLLDDCNATGTCASPDAGDGGTDAVGEGGG